MKYGEFFQIEIVHHYFLDEIADLILLPEAQTRRLLEKQHFLIKRTGKGIKVLIPEKEKNTILSGIESNDVFVFHVFPTSDSVLEFTDTSGFENDKMMLFTNERLGVDNVELVRSETVQEGKFKGFSAMARVEIKASEVITDINVTSPVYQVVFNSKSIKWKYYFLANPDDSNIVIDAKDEQLQFKELEIKEDDTSDQIITSLRLNFPDTKILVFESNTSIPSSNKPIKDIKLIQKDSVIQADSTLIKHLPNPKSSDQGIQIIKIK
ncbi:hypothetical protein [Aquimarina sp. MMG016]|uniref:hypothetical protein n=1 Tax=Aquimarina sp. MMG016 TaxID=2822690 RepID=UPI001B39F70E|nr:hypothetical protein [Aquimarina sp. MMG016]MBQ4820707.1 hypothetical protein [Aquimarina sp. MMG016]